MEATGARRLASQITLPQPAAPSPPPFTDAHVDQLHEMFPGMEREIVRSVLVANKGNMDAALNALLSMQTS
jgi:toll-interacting protein